MTATLVRDRLVSLGITGSGTASGSSWVCLVGGLSDRVDAPQVAVIDTGGLSPLDAHGTTGPTRPGIQVLVRGAPNAYALTEAKAESIWDALHRSTWGTVMNIAGVNNPIWLGYESDTNRPLWSLNFLTLTR
jgi:hypothetical protein